MRIVLHKSGSVAIGEIPVSAIVPGTALVKVAHSFVSPGTERAIVAQPSPPFQERLNYEKKRVEQVVGRLRASGARATAEFLLSRTKMKRGDIGSPLGYSSSGHVIQSAADLSIPVNTPVACVGVGVGCHAEFTVVPRNLLVPLPRGCNTREGSSAALGAIALQGLRRANPSIGDVVVVIGLGLIGQLTLQLLRANGCRALGLDPDLRRSELAEKLTNFQCFTSLEELHRSVLHQSRDHGADLSLITASSASDEILQNAMLVTRKKGRVVLIGDVGLNLQRSPFYEKEIDLLISCSYGPGRYDANYEENGQDYPYAYVRWTERRNVEEYLKLLADKQIDIAPLIDREFDFDSAEAAYHELNHGEPKPLGLLLSYPDVTAQPAQWLTPPRVKRHPEGQVSLAVVGAGAFARTTLLPLLVKDERAHVHALVSKSGVRAQKLASQFGVPNAGTDLDELLRDPVLDGVVVATRHNLHVEHTLKALQHGKSVYCEKPLAINHSQLRELKGHFEDQGTSSAVLMVGYNRRFSPAARELQARLRGRGTPLVATYRMNAGRIPEDSWLHGPEGGGRLIGECCHLVDLLRFLVGSEHISVAGCGVGVSSGLSPNENAAFTVEYADGSIASILYTSIGSAAVDKEFLEVHCEGRTYAVNNFQSLSVDGREVGTWSTDQQKGHAQALEGFCQAVQGTRGWPIPLQELFETTEVTIAMDAISKRSREDTEAQR